jgi:hypothetical protein
MKINVPYRKVDIYESDDGRRVQVYTKKGELETEFPEGEELPEQLDISTEEVLYMGLLQLQFIDGNRDIPFVIPEATSVDDAFHKFNEVAPGIINDIYEKEKASDNGIIPASEGDFTTMGEGGIVVPDGYNG